MKYFAQLLFNGTTINSANTSGTSVQFDLGESIRIWHQVTPTSVNSISDVSIQFQVSNDAMNVPAGLSNWISQDSANVISGSAGTSVFITHTNVGAQKGRLVVTRNSGSSVLTIRTVGKPA